MFGGIVQLLQWVAATPPIIRALSFDIPRLVRQLSPETKEKIARIVRWGVEQTARQTLSSVLGEVGHRIVDQVVANPDVAELAKTLVERGVEIGVEKALQEAKITA